MTYYFDTECRAEFGDSTPDPAQSDDEHLGSGQLISAISLPVFVRLPCIEPRHLLREVQSRHHRKLRQRLRVDPCGVRHDNVRTGDADQIKLRTDPRA